MRFKLLHLKLIDFFCHNRYVIFEPLTFKLFLNFHVTFLCPERLALMSVSEAV